MFQRVAISVVVAVLVYGAVSWITLQRENFVNYKLADQSYEHAEPQQAPPAYAERQVAPAGPSAPAVRATGAPRVMPEEEPRDPSFEGYESSDIPERLRHPEKMFGPGVVGDDTQIAEAAGVAKQSQEKVAQAFTLFSPEYAQNGGEFMDGGITAFDIDVPNTYSEL